MNPSPLSSMDYVRAAMLNALMEDLEVADLFIAAENASTAEQFDEAVNRMATSASPSFLEEEYSDFFPNLG